MFPRAITLHRGAPGSFGLVSLPEIYETSTGGASISPLITYATTDPSDVLEWEYYNGTSWVSEPGGEAGIEAISYQPGRAYRVRLTNNFFGSATAYQTSPNSTVEKTGGSSALSSSMATPSSPTLVTISSSAPGSRTVSFSSDITRTNMLDTRVLYGKYVSVQVNWQEQDAPGGTLTSSYSVTKTGNHWLPSELGVIGDASTGVYIAHNTFGSSTHNYTITIPLTQFFAYFISMTITFGSQYVDAAGPTKSVTRNF